MAASRAVKQKHGRDTIPQRSDAAKLIAGTEGREPLHVSLRAYLQWLLRGWEPPRAGGGDCAAGPAAYWAAFGEEYVEIDDEVNH